MAKKEIEVIARGGAKTVAKKKSFIWTIKSIFAVFAICWIAVLGVGPYLVKVKYEQPIKKSIVVGMFFDLQKQISSQYEKMLDKIKDSINLEKPINAAIDKMKVADKAVAKTQETTAKVEEKTAKVSKLSGLASKLGANTKGVDKAVAKVNDAADKVDNTAALVNEKLDKVKTELTKTAQAEIDTMIDNEIKKVADKGLGGLGSTLLTNYDVKHVYPWLPSSWKVADKIYSDLEKSSSGTVSTIMATVNNYFGFVAWGILALVWLVALIILFYVRKYMKKITAPFIVCPRCGHAFMDKRTGFGLLKLFKPQEWI
jgi:hypothetical protein